MAKSTRLPASTNRAKDKRRLHLREIKDDPQAPLDSVGATLRAARLNRGLDPDHVAAGLKMRRDHVEAIEDNDFTRLPGRTYAIGFVRAYSRYLGLDAEVMVQRFKEESAGREHDKAVDLVFPDAPEEKRSSNGSLFLVAVVIAGAIGGAYYASMPARHVATKAGPSAEPAVVVSDPAETLSSTTLVQPPSQLTQATQPAASFVAPPLAASPASTPPQTNAAPLSTPIAAPAPDSPRVFGSENAGARIVFRATAPTYILVKERGPEGKITLIDRTLNPGETYRAPNKPGITLVTGNAGGLEIEIDGKKVGTLGKTGEMLRNVPVDASYFVERLASAATVVTPAPVSARPPAPAPATPAAPAPPRPPRASKPQPDMSSGTPAPPRPTTPPAQ
jgi:cytoskeleton protein RodZ